jgi:L-amino acid N-acyltransferase YncA
MLPEQIKNYREIITLRDGANVLLRPMTAEDEKGLIDMFAPVSDDDLRYLRDNVRDPAVIQGWCRKMDYARVLPLLAIVKDRVVGQITLHFRKGPRRHIGEVRIYLTVDFRQRGLGTKMLKTVIELARKQSLHILVAEIVTEQPQVIKAFQNLGFILRCTFEDFFMFPDGDLRDSVILTLPLKPKSYEF